ncbi:MAG TPA: sensor histidine kinase, partial [Clostridiaceae bacterium]|nr:sensor histidine kinase [Clostridiaceae bacterium]
SLTVIRNTAYNIKPKEEIGIGYIEKLIKEFKFCNVDFKHTGDVLSIPSSIVEIINTNIKEALTNASKYSNADNIIIRLDVNEKFVRLYIKDNGKGAVNIKEGLGLSGMRERVKNAGGSISISGEDGFLIVCIIPLDFGEGGSVFEGFSS